MNSRPSPYIEPGHEYHVVELTHMPTMGVINWLQTQMPYDSEDGHRRWIVKGAKIYFRSEMDHLLFLLNIDR